MRMSTPTTTCKKCGKMIIADRLDKRTQYCLICLNREQFFNKNIVKNEQEVK